MADNMGEKNRERVVAQPDSPNSAERDLEIDGILQSWRVAPPASLEERILKEVRILGAARSRRWSGEIRVPWWLAAACLALLALMLPLAVRGLRAGSPAAPSPSRPSTELTQPAQASSMVTRISNAADSYLTVADLSRLRPTRDVNIQVLKAKEIER